MTVASLRRLFLCSVWKTITLVRVSPLQFAMWSVPWMLLLVLSLNYFAIFFLSFCFHVRTFVFACKIISLRLLMFWWLIWAYPFVCENFCFCYFPLVFVPWIWCSVSVFRPWCFTFWFNFHCSVSVVWCRFSERLSLLSLSWKIQEEKKQKNSL